MEMTIGNRISITLMIVRNDLMLNLGSKLAISMKNKHFAANSLLERESHGTTKTVLASVSIQIRIDPEEFNPLSCRFALDLP